MATIIVTVIAMLIIVAAMAIGVIMGRKPIAGSCGGVGAALNDPDYVCDLCGNDPNKCEELSDQAAKSAKPEQFYDATNR